jgi:hypothetical protein
MRPPSAKLANPTSKTARKNLLNDIGIENRNLRKVIAPEQKLILPEAIGTETETRYAQRDSEE